MYFLYLLQLLLVIIQSGTCINCSSCLLRLKSLASKFGSFGPIVTNFNPSKTLTKHHPIWNLYQLFKLLAKTLVKLYLF